MSNRGLKTKFIVFKTDTYNILMHGHYSFCAPKDIEKIFKTITDNRTAYNVILSAHNTYRFYAGFEMLSGPIPQCSFTPEMIDYLKSTIESINGRCASTQRSQELFFKDIRDRWVLNKDFVYASDLINNIHEYTKYLPINLHRVAGLSDVFKNIKTETEFKDLVDRGKEFINNPNDRLNLINRNPILYVQIAVCFLSVLEKLTSHSLNKAKAHEEIFLKRSLFSSTMLNTLNLGYYVYKTKYLTGYYNKFATVNENLELISLESIYGLLKPEPFINYEHIIYPNEVCKALKITKLEDIKKIHVEPESLINVIHIPSQEFADLRNLAPLRQELLSHIQTLIVDK